MKESYYNPKIHHRRSIRLKGYDYSQEGSYFVTICCQDFKWRFGRVECGEMVYNEFGLIAYEEWAKLSERFPNFELDVFQIMPNHVHGIVVLKSIDASHKEFTDTTRETVGAPLAGAPACQPKVDTTDQPEVGDFAAQNPAGAPARVGAPARGAPLPLAISSVHTNQSSPRIPLKSINQKIKPWENSGNVIFMNTSFATNTLIKTFLNTSLKILRIGPKINFTVNGNVCPNENKE